MQYATEITTFSYKMRTLIRSLTMGIFKVFCNLQTVIVLL